MSTIQQEHQPRCSGWQARVQNVCTDLRAAGIALAPSRVPGKVRVRSIDALTPERRQAILTHKPAILAVLELEQRIRAMAARWQYTIDDLAYALEDAERLPEAWLACCEWDDALTAKCERAGLSWPL